MTDERQAGLREALETIREICKPMSMTMQGPVWFDGGTPAGGGSRERIWRICDEALAAQLPAREERLDAGRLLDGIRDEVREAVEEGDRQDCSSSDCIADAVYDIVRVRLRALGDESKEEGWGAIEKTR